MNWGNLVTGIFETIGGVVGGLLGVNSIEDGVLFYSHAGINGASQDFSSTFYCEDEKYYLYNQSPLKTDVVTLSFPTVGNQGAQTFTVVGKQSFDITKLFKDQAKIEQCQFKLAASSMQKQLTGSDGTPQSAAKIATSGYEIPLGQKRSLGSYMDVTLQENQVLITPKGGMQMESLQMLSVQGSGDASMVVVDAPAQNGEVIVQLTKPLLSNSLFSVDVMASIVGQQKTMLAHQENDSRYQTVNDDLAMRIRNAPKLNWGKK
jgi:hypothetical protein